MIKFDSILVEKEGFKVLDRLDLHIQVGECVVLTGPSGAGKSSVLKSVMGALPVNDGTVYVGGRELALDSVQDIRSLVAFIGQEPVMGAEIVRDALLLPYSFKSNAGKHPDEKKILELLEAVSLDKSILDKKTAIISGGEKQRIAIVRALLMKKPIILADEFTSALDPVSKSKVIELLKLSGKTILSVSHDSDWITACSRIVKIENGTVIREGGTVT